MQIHELNSYRGNLDSSAFMAVDNGTDTGKVAVSEITGPLNERIDNIIGGTAPSAAEVSDARLGANGIVYPTLGDAIRKQIGRLEGDLSDIYVTNILSLNILDPSNTETGAIGSDGSLMTNGIYGNYVTSDFIELEPETDYYFSNYYVSSDQQSIDTGRKLLLLYDSAKTVITGSHQNTEGATELTFNTSSNVKYVRVSRSTTLIYSQLAKGTTYGPFVPYDAEYRITAKLGATPIAQVNDLINNSGIITFEVGKNLANPNTTVTGAIQSDGTVNSAGAWSGYKTSDYIEIEPGENYVFSQWSDQQLLATGRMLLILFDENKLPIIGTHQNTDAVTNLTFSNANAKYVRVSGRSYMIFQVEEGTTPTEFEPFTGKYVMAYPLGNVPLEQVQADNVLYKKKWAVCGDSFTNGATNNTLDDGRYAGMKIVYPYIIGNRNNMEIVKFFGGGETLAYPEDGSFSNSLTAPGVSINYKNIPADVDYITIYLGINDGNHNSGSSPDGESTQGYIGLGTIDDNTTATYYGAWNVVLSWLIENRPFAHIGIIVSNGLVSEEWRTAQLEIAKKYGIPYIDLNGDNRTPVMIRSQNPDIAAAVKTIVNKKQAVDYPSNTHPNDEAHEYESTFIEEFLRSI